MNLILITTEGDDCTYSYELHIAFEYKSKEDFIFDILEKLQSVEHISPFVDNKDIIFDNDNIHTLEYMIFSVDEWLIKNKSNISI